MSCQLSRLYFLVFFSFHLLFGLFFVGGIVFFLFCSWCDWIFRLGLDTLLFYVGFGY